MDLLQVQADQLQSIIQNYEVKLAVMRDILNRDVHSRDCNGDTPLHLVLKYIRANSDSIIRQLLETGALVNSGNDSGLSPLHYAAKYKNCDVTILKLLMDKKADVHKMDKWGLTPLFYAVINKNCPLDVVTFLIENGADVHLVDKSGCTLLHHAVITDGISIDLIKLLVDKGVDYHALNVYGESVVHLAVRYNQKNILELFLNLPGVKVNLSDKKQCSPLHRALCSSSPDPDIVRMLLNAGANVKKKAKYSQQSLHLAAYKCEAPVVKLLLEQGALVNALDKYSQTPLFIAVKHSENEANCDSLKLLLDAGALVFPDHPMRKMYPRDGSPFDLVSPLHVAIETHNSNRDELSLRRVQLLLKYALLERPALCFEDLRADDPQISQLGTECLREMHSTCLDGSTTLGEFILRSRLREDDDNTDNILMILAAKAHPLYRELISGLLVREALVEKFKEQEVYVVREGEPRAANRILLNYDSLCIVMSYLSDEELLSLMLAFYHPRNSKADSYIEFVTPTTKTRRDIQCEAERFFKRARLS